jgi:hypothetical protein
MIRSLGLAHLRTLRELETGKPGLLLQENAVMNSAMTGRTGQLISVTRATICLQQLSISS